MIGERPARWPVSHGCIAVSAVLVPSFHFIQRKGAKTRARARVEAVGLKEPSETSRHRQRAVAIGVAVAVAVVEVARGKPTSKQPQRRIRKGAR